MVDLLVVGGDIVTMDPLRRVLRRAAVAVAQGAIVAIGDADELRAAHPSARVVGGETSVVTPGYVNAHQHLTGDRLIRSAIPDDIDGDESIFGWAVPVHEAHTADDDELSATLSLVEAVGNGITTTIEAGTVAHPERVAAAMRRVGVRGTIGRWGWDVGGGPQAAHAPEVIDRQAALVDAFPAGAGLVQAWVTLVGHDLMSDELVVAASDLARDRGTGLTFHMSPHRGDAAAYLVRTGQRPLVHLDRLGVLGRHVVVAHAVHVDDAEVEAIVRTETAVAACPWAYLRLAQGVTGAGRHGDLWRAGGRLAIGCDSENAGDAIDALRAAALFVGLVRDQADDPTSITAHGGLELLTIRAAEAIGWDDRIGSIEVGKQADLVVHRTDGPQWLPRSPDPVRQLVWASDGRSVSDVVVAGNVVVSDGRCVTVDIDDLRADASRRSVELLGIVGGHHRPDDR